MAVFFSSLLVSLVVLELGLRLTGQAISSSRESRHVPPYVDEIPDADYAFERFESGGARERLILTFGDSLTNAGNVKSYHSYPYFLYRSFTDAGSRTSVYNMAKCEESTFGVAAKLKRYLEEKPAQRTPDAIVILVGAADLFNLPLVKGKMEDDGTAWQNVLPGGWIHTLRIAKVLRHIKLNLLTRYGFAGKDDSGGSMTGRLETLLEVYEDHKAALGEDRRRDLSPALVRKVRRSFADGDTERDDLEIERVGDFISFLADYGSIVYTPLVRYDKFFSLLLDMVETFPRSFWTPEFDTAEYYLVQTYRLQSKFTAVDVLKVLDRSAAMHPELRGNASFANFRKYLAERRQMDEFIDRKRMEAWKDIVGMSRARGIRVVVQTYPVEYKSANRILKSVAAKYDLDLIDNEKQFSKLIEDRGRGAYLEDNDHMTPPGYEILAGNVFAVLARE